MTQTSRIKEEVKAQACHIQTKEVLKSELDHIKDLFASYNQVKSIDARRMVIEEMLKLYKSEHNEYADRALDIFQNVKMPKAVYDYLRPKIELKLSWKNRVLGWFR